VLYGNGNAPTTLALQPRQVVAVLEGPYGRNSVVDLDIEGTNRMAIVKDYQVHPWKRKLLHIDFMEITDSTSLTLTVPFRTVGHAAAEQIGARIEKHRDAVNVRCMAANIPAAIEYDMAQIEGEYAEISISDVPMPDGVEALYRKEFKVLRLRVPSAAELAAEEAAEAAELGAAEETEEGAEEGTEEGTEEATEEATEE
jgi:large subunit ribosomal protein L25